MPSVIRRAISIREPWLWLITRPDVIGDEARRALYEDKTIKDFENRSRYSSFSGEVWLHASKSPDDDYENLRLHYWNALGIRIPAFPELKVGGIRGRAMFEKYATFSASPWFQGIGGYPIFSAEPVAFVPCKGALGFFSLPETIQLPA